MKINIALCLLVGHLSVMAQHKPAHIIATGSVTKIIPVPGRNEFVGQQGNQIKLWNTAGITSTIALVSKCFDISPDGRLLVVSTGRELKIQQLHNVTKKPLVLEQSSGIKTAKFTPNGQFIIGGGSDKLLRVWNAFDGALKKVYIPHPKAVEQIIISPDGIYIASATKSGMIYLWEFETGKELSTLNVEQESPIFSFTSNSKCIWSIAGNSEMKKWEVLSGRNLSSATIRLPRIISKHVVAFSPNGNLAVSTGKQALLIWDINRRTVLDSLACESEYTNTISFSTDGQFLAVSTGDREKPDSDLFIEKKIKTWSINSWIEKVHREAPIEEPIFIDNRPVIPIKSQIVFTRFALVIGNSHYPHGSSLDGNPINDANAIGQRLKDLNFKVVKLIDVRKVDIIKEIHSFTKEAQGCEISLFFYAGHGVEVGGQNYLVPVDATLKFRDNAPEEAVALSTILNEMRQINSKVSLVYLDACRNDPFRSWGRGSSSGFKAIGTPFPAFNVFYATQPNSVAANGDGQNGLFTTALLKYLRKGVDIEDVMRKVTSEVRTLSNQQQIPYAEGSLMSIDPVTF